MAKTARVDNFKICNLLYFSNIYVPTIFCVGACTKFIMQKLISRSDKSKNLVAIRFYTWSEEAHNLLKVIDIVSKFIMKLSKVKEIVAYIEPLFFYVVICYILGRVYQLVFQAKSIWKILWQNVQLIFGKMRILA